MWEELTPTFPGSQPNWKQLFSPSFGNTTFPALMQSMRYFFTVKYHFMSSFFFFCICVLEAVMLAAQPRYKFRF